MSLHTLLRHVASAVAVLGLTLLAGSASAFPGMGILYGTDASGGNLLTINTGDGSGTIVGNMGIVVPSLDVDPNSGIIYAGHGGGTPTLHTVSAVDGSSNLVGDTGLGFAAIGALEFHPDGTLYASVNIAGDGGTGSDHLAIIDPTDASTVVIGPYGTCSGVSVPSDGSGSCDLDGMEAIAFDLSGTLWGAHRDKGTGSTNLYTINTGTGAATLVGPLVDGSGIVATIQIVSLQFDCDGNAWGGTAQSGGGAGDGGRLVTIDVNTLTFSAVGTATSGSSLGGLSFDSGCPVPTEESTWGRVKSTYR